MCRNTVAFAVRLAWNMYALRLLCWTALARYTNGLLIFSNASVFQITSSISVPVLQLPPSRKVYFDWGLQMNYNSPYKLSSFYNVPIWPGLWNQQRHRRDLTTNQTDTAAFAKYMPEAKFGSRQHADYTAGELYKGLELLLVSAGYHATCLLHSVCELARHPFADVQQHVLIEALTFLLSPSLHCGFAASERELAASYERAELHGILGEDCDRLYAACEHNLLNLITTVKRTYVGE